MLSEENNLATQIIENLYDNHEQITPNSLYFIDKKLALHITNVYLYEKNNIRSFIGIIDPW